MQTKSGKENEDTALARTQPGRELSPILDRASEFLHAAKAPNTVAAYRSDWEDFSGWCRAHGLSPLPASPETVMAFVADLSGRRKVSTIQRRVAAISIAHQAAGHESPTRTSLVRETLKGIRRTFGVDPRRVVPIRVEHLREIAPKLEGSLQAIRDKALLLFGYAGAFRRSELVSLNLEDLTFTQDGVRVNLRRSKTDQEGEGQVKGIGHGMNAVTCPVKALQAWMEVAGITSGPVFRAISRHGQISEAPLSDKGIVLVVKRIAKRLGVAPDTVGGHSLRAGFVTDQYARGTAEGVIMQQTGHKSRAVLAQYRREADAFAFNFTAAAGL